MVTTVFFYTWAGLKSALPFFYQTLQGSSIHDPVYMPIALHTLISFLSFLAPPSIFQAVPKYKAVAVFVNDNCLLFRRRVHHLENKFWLIARNVLKKINLIAF